MNLAIRLAKNLGKEVKEKVREFHLDPFWLPFIRPKPVLKKATARDLTSTRYALVTTALPGGCRQFALL